MAKRFRTKVIATSFQPLGNLETPDTTAVTVLEKDRSGMILKATGLTVPGDGEAGFAKGCFFIDTDIGAGSTGIYENVGTITAADFDAIGSGGGATAWIQLTDTAATLVGQGDKICKVNTGGTAIELVTPSGDAAMDLLGAFTVTDLTMAGEAQGDILYFDGANWVPLAAGTNGYILQTQGAAADPVWADPTTLPTGIASKVTQTYQIEAGANDIVHAVTTQTVGSPELTIPDFANVDDTYVFTTLAQTLAAKTLTSPILGTQVTLDQTTADYTLTWDDPAGARAISISDPGGADVFAWLDAAQTMTNKTLTSAVLNTGVSGTAVLDEDNMATDSATQVATQQSIKAYVDAGTVTMTNKSIDAATNTLTNVNGEELDPIAATAGTYGIPFILTVPNAGSATVSIFNADAPFKFRVLDAWGIDTQAGNAGNWKIDNGAADVTSTVAYAASDTLISRADSVDDVTHDIAASGSLRLINSNAADTSIVYISCVRVD